MKKALLIALIDSIISEKIELTTKSGPRGPRGFRGIDGQFDWDLNKDNVKELIENHIDTIQDQLKLTYDDLSPEEKNLLLGKQGPRGQRGKQGKSFVFEEEKEKLTDIIYKLYFETKSELKLKFSELTEDEKDELKLKFSELTKEDILKITGPQGEQGVRGFRGQVGKRGRSFDFEEEKEKIESILSNQVDLRKDEYKLKFSELSPKEVKSLEGPKGLPGVTGLRGEKGEDGRPAKEIEDIQVMQVKGEFYFVFYFDDQTSIETEKISLPQITNYVQQVMQIGGGSGTTLTTEKDGTELGLTETINFVGSNLDVTYDALNKKIDVEVTDNDVPDCIEIKDEGTSVTDCVKSIDFIGDNVQIVSQTVMGDWVTLSTVDPLTQEIANPGHVKVEVLDQDFAKFLKDTGVCSEPIAAGRYITVINDATNEVAYAQYNVADKAWAEGITLNAGAIGESVEYLLIGKHSVSGNTIPRNYPVFLGLNGLPASTAPVDGYISIVGKSRGPSSMFFNPAEPIFTGVP